MNKENGLSQSLDTTTTPSTCETEGASPIEIKGMKRMLETIELASIHKSSGSSVDLSDFTTHQKDKLLEMMSQNEQNAFEYNMKRLDVSERLNTKALAASIVNQKTLRVVLIGGGISFFVAFVLILFFKPDFMQIFLSFITGLIGGFGLKEVFGKLIVKSNIEIKDEDNDD